MKTVIIIRHAKSSWADANTTDFERPLHEKGKNDAITMAQELLKRNILIDVFISSPAKRAKKTAEIFSKELNVPNIVFIEGLYHAPASFLYSTIKNTADSINTIAIFAHNPGITDFVNKLTNKIRTDNVPTCGVFAVRAHINTWKNFKEENKEFLFYDYPKLKD